MNRTDKAALAAELKEKFSKAPVAMFADYKGLKASEADDLRRKLRASDTEIKVLKNNIARLIVKDGEFGDDARQLMDEVVGPTMVAFALGDVAAAAKAFHGFSKDNEALQLKDSLMEGKRIKAADIEALASLPSREVLLSMLLSAMQGPARGFVTVLSGVPRAMVTVLSALEKKKAEDGQG